LFFFFFFFFFLQLLELVAMDELDEEDLDESDDDESAAERALLVAALCMRREAELDGHGDEDEGDGETDVGDADGPAEHAGAWLLAELPRSRKRLLTTLRENMEWIASGEAAGGACAAFERLQDIPSAFPYLDSSGQLTRERF
jgi:hypothetical protein